MIATANDNGVEEELIERIARRDPDKALALLKDIKSTTGSSAHTEVWNAVLAGCAENGPDYALAAIQSAPRDAQDSGMYSLLSAMAAKDPRAALAWSDALPPELKALTDKAAIVDTWGESDPAAALKAWMEMPDLPQKCIGQDLAAKWAAKDPEAFIQWANAQGEKAGEFVGVAALTMVSIDPQHAAGMAAQLPSAVLVPQDPDSSLADPFADGGRDLRCAIGQKWVQKDPAAALAWARSLPDQERYSVINGMRPYLTDLPGEELRTVAQELGTGTAAGFQMLWEADRDEAGRVFAAQTPEQKLRNFSSLAYSITAESPATAANLLQGVIKDYVDAASSRTFEPADSDNSRNAAIIHDLSRYVAELTSSWAGRDPAAAAAWVRQLPPGESQVIAAANVVLTWGRYDLPAATAWVEKLPAGAARDTGVKHLAELNAISGGE